MQGDDGWLEDPSDFEDVFLQQVVNASLPPRLPVSGMRVGDREGRRYEILAELGGGAMGQVFRALDTELQRTVALKFLVPQESLNDVSLITLLRQEGRAIARLDHENIVRIHNVDAWSSGPGEPTVPFLVMECLEGESLSALLRRARPEPHRAMEILDQIAAGLAHAHEHRIVHRDLKPSNVFITRAGGVKILDFGLAWLAAATAPPDVSLASAGTPPYMAPEQWRGEAQDERTDLWAAGVLLFEMLTGETPYRGTPDELRARVTSSEPAPSVRDRVPALPEAVERLVASLLAKDPARRLGSAGELRERLRHVEQGLAPRRVVSTAPPQRRQVTLVACQLSDLAGLTARLDAEDLGELEAVFHRSCADLLREHGGTVVLCIGEVVLGCFGHPVTHEDDSEQAVRAGLHLASDVGPALADALLLPPDRELAVKVGVHTDMVVLDGGTAELRGQAPTIQGEAPRMAVWLAGQADPGSVWLSDATYTLVRGAYETEALALLHFTGLSGVHDVAPHRLLRPHKTASRFDRFLRVYPLTPLVGRRAELQHLEDWWAAARDGQGSFVFVTGEAGLGKSRLLRELRERVPRGSAHLLRCQCWPESSGSAFAPVIALLRHFFALDDVGSQERQAAQLEAGLSALGLSAERIRLVAGLLGLSLDESAPYLRLAPELLRQETMEALTDVLLRLAERRPVLAEVEDLHWADPSTLQLLGVVLERLGNARACVVLTARPDLQPPWATHPRVHPLTLERLPAALAGELVRQAAGRQGVASETVAKLVEKADGIPLFVEELTRVVVERVPRQDAGEAVSSVPLTLRELLLTRLDRLPPAQKALAQLCAVVGRGFSHPLLAAVSGRTGASLNRDLTGLVTEGLLEVEEGSEPRYTFRHALILDAAADSLTRRQRRQYHKRAARVLMEQFPQVADARPELMAWHYTESEQRGEAIRWWAKAGEQAIQRFANAEAVDHLRRALEFLRALPPSRESSGQELRLLITLEMPLVQLQGYSAPEVEAAQDRVLTLLRELEEDLPALDPPYWVPFASAFARARFDDAYTLAELVVRLGKRTGQKDLLALGYRMRATAFFTWGRTEAALENVDLALDHSDFDLEQHRVLAVKHQINPRVVALAYAAVVHAVLDAPEVSREHGLEALRLAEAISHHNTLAYALLYASLAAQLRRDPDVVVALCDRNIALSSRHHFRLWLAWSTLLRAWALASLGKPEEGLERMQVALDQWQGSGVLAGLPHGLGMLAEIHLWRGQASEAMEALRKAFGLVEKTGERSYEAELWRLKGQALRVLGQEAESGEAFARALEVALRQGAFAFGRRAWEAWRPEAVGSWAHV